jgi:hypothetical protein
VSFDEAGREVQGTGQELAGDDNLIRRAVDQNLGLQVTLVAVDRHVGTDDPSAGS